jgi:hypothetical protein
MHNKKLCITKSYAAGCGLARGKTYIRGGGGTLHQSLTNFCENNKLTIMTSMPIERSDTTSETDNLMIRHYNQPGSDESDSEGARNKQKKSKQKQKNNACTFYCCHCKKVYEMTTPKMNEHFEEHENEVLLLSDYEKVASSTILDIYTKTFEDFIMNPFHGEDLQDVIDIIRVGGLIKEQAKVIISLKIYFSSISSDAPQAAWMSMQQFQVIRNEMGLRDKVQGKGEKFLQPLLDLDNIEDSGSGWVYLGVSEISIKIIKSVDYGCNKYDYDDEIKTLEKKGILFNPKGQTECFKKCISNFLQVSLDNSDVQKYAHMENLKETVTLQEIEEWSLKCTFAKLQIFVLAKDKEKSDMYKVTPIFISKKTLGKQELNLLAVYNKDNSNRAHFMRILDIEKLLKQTNFEGSHKKNIICHYCYNFTTFRGYVMRRHELNCLENPNSNRYDQSSKERIVFPTETSYLKCRNEQCRNPPNWIGFLDFETVNQNVENWEELRNVCPDHRLQGHQICDCSFTYSSNAIKSLSYNLLIVDFNDKVVVYDDFYIKKSKFDLDAGQNLALTLVELAYAFTLLHQVNYPIEMTEKEKRDHANATHCDICKREFAPRIDKQDLLNNIGRSNLEGIKIPCKVRHHLHHRKGLNFLRTLCSKCNLAVQSKRQEIPIFCHNFSRFDHIFLLKYLCSNWGNRIKVIAKSSNHIMSIFAHPFVLKDSLNFLSGSLDSNVALLKESCYVRCDICKKEDRPCNTCEEVTFQNFKTNFGTIFRSDLSNVDGIFSANRFKDNLKKAAFPYSLLSSYDNLTKMIDFPNYEAFFSILKNKNVEKSEYEAAKNYFGKYCGNMLDFLRIYNRLDCHLLYSCWTTMSKILQSNFELYPENFHTLPAYSFEVAKFNLRKESDQLETCIELFDEQNRDIYFKAMDSIRGGVVMSNIKFKLNSSFEDILLQTKPNGEPNCNTIKKDIVYIDATNLYGYSLSSLLPYQGYKYFPAELVKELNDTLAMDSFKKKIDLLEVFLPDNSEKGYAFEIEIINIPGYLHEFPPFFEHQHVSPSNLSVHDLNLYKSIYDVPFGGTKGKTLLPILDPRKSYFTHYRNMKEAVKRGVQLKVLSGIMFDQKYLFKPYLEKLSKLRSQTSNPVYKRAFKLQSNSLFGKTLQSPLNYADEYYFYHSQDPEFKDILTSMGSKIRERNYRNKPFLFKDMKILDKDFFMVQTQSLQVEATNCPMIAFCVLELAKLRNFSFYWKMKIESPYLELLYCDTDSFILACPSSWYSDIWKMKEDFDFFDAPDYMKKKLGLTETYMLSARGEIGRYKLETKRDSILIGLVALQKKAYCLLLLKEYFQDGERKIYKLQGNPTAKRLDTKQLDFKTYLKALISNKVPPQLKRKFEQRNKQLYLVMKRYKCLNSFDVSNFTKHCGVHNVPFSARNMSNYICNEPSCKHALHHVLEEEIDHLSTKCFFFVDEKLCLTDDIFN